MKHLILLTLLVGGPAFAQSTNEIASPTIVKDYVACVAGQSEIVAGQAGCDFKKNFNAEYMDLVLECNGRTFSKESRRTADLKGLVNILGDLQKLAPGIFTGQINKSVAACGQKGVFLMDEHGNSSFQVLEIVK